MNLLLDTHVLLWALNQPEKLGARARDALEAPENTVFVSAVSLWEIEIKRSLGKLRVPDDLLAAIQAVRFTELALRARHVQKLGALPALHRDPFDRMLIAQANADALVLVTRDAQIKAYPVRTLLV